MSNSKRPKPKTRRHAKRGRKLGQTPKSLLKAATTVRRVLFTRKQSAHALGGISVSSVIRLENDGRLSKVRLRGETGQVFNPAEEVAALAATAE